MKFQLNRIGTQLMFQLIFLLVMRRMIQDKIPALQPCSLDIINCQWSLMRRHKFENQFLKRFWRGATTKIWKACQQQHRQPNFVAGDDDEDLCPEKKAKKKKQGGVSSKPWGSLVFNTLPNLVVEMMDLLEDGAPNKNLQEAEASLSIFNSRSKLNNSET